MRACKAKKRPTRDSKHYRHREGHHILLQQVSDETWGFRAAIVGLKGQPVGGFTGVELLTAKTRGHTRQLPMCYSHGFTY